MMGAPPAIAIPYTNTYGIALALFVYTRVILR